MTDDLHDDIREIRNLVTQNLAETIAIKTAVWPSPGQPSKFEEHDERLSKLEGWRSFLAGAWFVVTFVASTVFGIHIHGSGK